MRRILFFYLYLLVLPAAAQSRINCDALNSRILHEPVHYCVLLPAGYDSPAQKTTRYPVLYFLHGLGENEQTLFKSGGWNLVQDLRQQHKIGEFFIVTPQAKASFYVNSADGRIRYSDFFLQEFMPFIESGYRIHHDRRRRAISGISMGGYGAFRYAFGYPERFSAVSAESAALITASPQELDATMRSGTPLSTILGSVFGNPINVAHWNANNPFVLAKRNRIAMRDLAIYFNCGREDQYDFEDGAEVLHRQLDSEGVKNEFHLYPGDHSASYFLTHLGEVMEFHSHVFEGSPK
jgi:S-formylglutathione hydrolase FrmB